MKRYLILIVCLIFWGGMKGQNLVPNPRLEDTITCPLGLNRFNDCAIWRNYGESPDYFNSCSSSINNVPNAAFGFQYGHAGGNAYAGIDTWNIPQEFPNYREFIGVQLTQQLQIGQKYYVSFFVNQSGSPTEAVGTNKMGCKFSTVAFDSCCPPPVNNFADIYSDSIIVDSVNWTEISGSFIADSSYSYFIIGNFFDDSHTDTIGLSQHNGVGYYYVTDVAVSTDSVYTKTWWTGEGLPKELNNQNKISIYPNPTNDIIAIKSTKAITTYILSNTIGQIIKEGKLNGDETTIEISALPNGIYILALDGRSFYKISVIH